MADHSEDEIPEGAAVFPPIPPELGVHPMTLAVLHAIVFLAGSKAAIVQGAAAEEAVEMMAEYMRRLAGKRLKEVREDIDCIIRYARQQKWPKQFVRALQSFLFDCGIHGDEDDSD
jgi:hypothetical protein